MKTDATSGGSIFLRAALTYAARGWAVFPLGQKSKRPEPGSNGVLDATTDEAQIKEWWSANPIANIGIATGASSLAVIDIDGPEGEKSLTAYAGTLPATVTAFTPGGGRHVIFRYSGSVLAPGVNILGKGIDLRVANSYIVAPPSIHPNGGVYRWDKDSHPARVELANLPAELIATLRHLGTPERGMTDHVSTMQGASDPDMIEDGQDEYGARQAAVLARKGFAKQEAKAALEGDDRNPVRGGMGRARPPATVETGRRGALA